MSNSARGKLYRTRRKKYTDGLGDYVEDLRKEVEDLQLYRRTQRETLLLHASPRSLDATASFARIVCEYFSLFEFGVPVVTSLDASSVSKDALVRSSRQAGFLNSMVSPDILFGGTRGVQLLLEQWERYSMYHTTLQFVLRTLDVVVADGPVISARAVLRVRFSRLTIQKIFPHVLWNEALVQRLVGRDIDYPVGNTFYFGADGKIHGYETEVDFICAFTAALGIQDSLELVDHALIKQQHIIGAEDEQGDTQVDEEVTRQRIVQADTSALAAPYQHPRADGDYSHTVMPLYTDLPPQQSYL